MLKIDPNVLEKQPISDDIKAEFLETHSEEALKQIYLTEQDIKDVMDTFNKVLGGEFLYPMQPKNGATWEARHIMWFIQMIMQYMLEYKEAVNPPEEFLMQLEIGCGEDGFFITRIPTEKLAEEFMNKNGTH